MSEPPVLYERVGRVGRITLNRPQQLNSFTVQMHEALRRTLDVVEQEDDLRVLILSGSGRAFCTGQDLNERAGMIREGAVDLGMTLEKWYEPLVLRLRRLPIPVIAAVNGIAAGAGMSLALVCDIVIAARSARFMQSFGRIGLVPDCGGTWLLPRLVGPARAAPMMFLSEATDAEEAERIGLIWRCVDDAGFPAFVAEVAERLCAASHATLGRTKQLLNETWGNTFEQQLRSEALHQRELGNTQNFRNAVIAFSEKRAFRFSDN